MSAQTFRLDAGVKLFLVILVAILVPVQWMAWFLYIFGATNIFSLSVFLILNRGNNRKSDTPGWVKVAMSPLGGYLKFNLVLVAIGLAVLWQFYPLWGGA